MNNTLIQANITDEVRGRVMSVYMMTIGLMPFGTLPAAWIAEAVGAPIVVAAGGAVLLLSTVAFAVLHPRLLRLE